MKRGVFILIAAVAFTVMLAQEAMAYRACCLPDGSCIRARHQTDCWSLNGVIQYNDRYCDNVVCPGDPCGNGEVDPGEECDDGNDDNDDRCTNDCKCPDEGSWYRLYNHPDGYAAPPFYGLRLDELVNVSDQNDVFTFDFDHGDSAMWMRVTDTTIEIEGVTAGGNVVNGAYGDYSGLWYVEFTYNIGVMPAPGDDDTVVDADNYSNFGSITPLFNDHGPFSLSDYRGSHAYSFRLGDGFDDQGHRGFPGTSGWGWLSDDETGAHTQDWLFTAELYDCP